MPFAGPRRGGLPLRGWVGLGLVAVFWSLNWGASGLRTHLCFFPLWLGYCLTVDAVGARLRGTSLLGRNPRLYVGLFAISVPLWWVFEAINLRTDNWYYVGREHFGDLEYFLLASLSFSTVVPAVLGTAEIVAGSRWIERCRDGPRWDPAGTRGRALFVTGLVMLVLVLAWPRFFFPLVWISLFLAVEAVNRRLGYRTLSEFTRRGDWRPVIALAAGALPCGLLWETWNYLSYPKWRYQVPFVDFWRVFEMPLLGYLGYLPFALEVFALVHLVFGLLGLGRTSYVLRGLCPQPRQ